jgi:hypothetical protein
LASARQRFTLAIAGLGVLVVLAIWSRYSKIAGTLPGGPTGGQDAPFVGDRLMGGAGLQQDEFRTSRGDSEAASSSDAANLDPAGIAAMYQPTATDASSAPVLPDPLLRTIRDDVLGMHSVETKAWYASLKLAGDLQPVSSSSLSNGQYALFMSSPESCRGRAFAIRGRLRRLVRKDLPDHPDSFGIRTVYDAWIRTRDSGSQKLHVVALSADAGLPLAEIDDEDAPDVELTGYFFKREGYAARGRSGNGELASAPLILAGRITRIARSTVVSQSDEFLTYLAWIGMGLCFVIAVLVWQFQASDHQFRGTRTYQLATTAPRPSFEGVESVSVVQALEAMEQQALGGDHAPTLL